MDDVIIADVPLAHLLKPGPHLDKFWLNTFPKKLHQELQRHPGTDHDVVGWGIRVNESLNWSIILLGLLILLVITGIGVIIYSVFKSDDSAAFGLGAFLMALVAVYLPYQYFAWKDDI